MKKRILHVIFGLIYIALMGIFSYFCLQSGNTSQETSNTVGEIIVEVGEQILNTEIKADSHFFYLTRKIVGHYLFFVTLGLFSFLFYYYFDKIKLQYRLLIHFSTGLIFALISEFVFQKIATQRYASFTDVCIDYLGFVTLSGIISLTMIIILIRRRKNVKTTT